MQSQIPTTYSSFYRAGKPLSRDALIPEIGALMMAGFDTSSHTIAWTLYALAVHPGLQADVREELARAGLLHGEYWCLYWHVRWTRRIC
jgi:cytochrome P450